MAIVVMVLHVPIANAELTVCNKGPMRISTALGYYASGQWSSRGWWNIAPGACTVILGGDLTAKKYYLYAEESGTSRTLSGRYPFCTQRSVFNVRGDKECVARGYQNTAFAELNVGDSLSYIANVSCKSDGCETRPGWFLEFPISRSADAITIDGRQFVAPMKGRVKVDFSGSTLYGRLTIEADLSSFQQGLPSIIQAHVNRNDDCNEIVNVHTISLSPQNGSLRVYAAGHYEDWECPWTEILGMRIDGGKHRIYEQNGDASVLLIPATDGDSVYMHVSVESMNADGLLGNLLRTNLFGPWIRDMILQGVPHVIHVGSIRQQLPAALRSAPVRLTAVAFTDQGGGRLGLYATAEVTVAAQWADFVWRSLLR